jgi:pyrimidine and pyridine-specific 5'-nucleotidase
MTRQARRIESRETIPARAVSCLDYCPQARILAAGFHDTGRVQVWRQGSSEEYELLHTLNGHLHGIRAIAWATFEIGAWREAELTCRISGEHLVSAGADKAIVVWHWPYVGRSTTYAAMRG